LHALRVPVKKCEGHCVSRTALRITRRVSSFPKA
jgi:hypothetical protein